MVRFFVAPEELLRKEVMLTGENAAHARVLRLREGEAVLLCDGRGREAVCTVAQAEGREYTLAIHERRDCAGEAAVQVSVYMAYPKSDKLEHVIQKATELGACEIVAFPSARCVSRPDERNLAKKAERWQRVAASAAEQSGRGRIPRVLTLESYAAALARAGKADKAILFYENEHSLPLSAALRQGDWRSLSILTGPEGGLEEREVAQARQAGLQVCTLGRRILRCETAPLCALTAAMYAAGEF